MPERVGVFNAYARKRSPKPRWCGVRRGGEEVLAELVSATVQRTGQGALHEQKVERLEGKGNPGELRTDRRSEAHELSEDGARRDEHKVRRREA
ncbi:hypothetical protein PWY87_08365 [Kribbella solani]|uniref:hypothetical protein n=1 Tax=Kribbella solani TaxID=236067 RepID=UPI0029A66C70|nr:hypothetical protein [Kribbella solani]MDX3001675.1 hypothetical protein [Kribbella solani]